MSETLALTNFSDDGYQETSCVYAKDDSEHETYEFVGPLIKDDWSSGLYFWDSK